MDEVLEIAEFASPSKWQKAMHMHGFEATMHTPSEFVEFCERLEFAESGETQNHSKGQRNSGTDQKGRNKDRISRAKSSEQGTKCKKDDKFCILHNTYGHSLDECKVMIDQAKRMRSSYEAKGIYKNQSWSRKDQENKKKKNEELNILIADAVSKALSAQKKQEEEEINNIDDLINLNLEEDDSSSK